MHPPVHPPVHRPMYPPHASPSASACASPYVTSSCIPLCTRLCIALCNLLMHPPVHPPVRAPVPAPVYQGRLNPSSASPKCAKAPAKHTHRPPRRPGGPNQTPTARCTWYVGVPMPWDGHAPVGLPAVEGRRRLRGEVAGGCGHLVPIPTHNFQHLIRAIPNPCQFIKNFVFLFGQVTYPNTIPDL